MGPCQLRMFCLQALTIAGLLPIQTSNVEYGPAELWTRYWSCIFSSHWRYFRYHQRTGHNNSHHAEYQLSMCLQTNCGSSTSVWEGPLTVTTRCLETAPWMDDFESSLQVRLIVLDVGVGINPRPTQDGMQTTEEPSPSTGPVVDNTTGLSTGMYMFLESSSPAALGDTNSLLSPIIDVTALTTPYLEFYYHMPYHGQSSCRCVRRY